MRRCGRTSGSDSAPGEGGSALLLEGSEALAVVVGVAQRGLRGVLDVDRLPQRQSFIADAGDEVFARQERLRGAASGRSGCIRRLALQLIVGKDPENRPDATASEPDMSLPV